MVFSTKITSSCKALAEQYSLTPNFFSVQNRQLGKIAIKHLNRFRLLRDNGKETYWGIAWIELGKEKGIYILKLRPELVEAIEELNWFTSDSLPKDRKSNEEIMENTVNMFMQRQDLRDLKRFEYLHERKEKCSRISSVTKTYPRNTVNAINALAHAEHKCEYDFCHNSFTRMTDGLPYMETHHLVPLEFSEEFDVSLDVPENIVCLCSTCHNCIHYGKDKEVIIEFLYQLRKFDLHQVGIDIDLSALKSLYQHKT